MPERTTNRRGKAAAGLAALVTITTAGVLTAAAGADPGWTEIGAGPDFTYGSPNPFTDADITVLAREVGDGGLQVRLAVQGADASGQRFGAHVHQNGCGLTGGAAGPHYLNTAADGSLRHREIWLDFTVDADGTGGATATRDWSLSGARSVILHAETTANDGAAGTRLACVDVDFDTLS